MTTQPLSVAYVTDKGLFLPTLRSAHSALSESRAPLRLLFLGDALEETMWTAVDRLARQYPESTVEKIEIPPAWLKGAATPKDFITRTALGRMFLPRVTGGRVLYIDGDTLVAGDVTQAAQLDMHNMPLAGVRDFAVMSWIGLNKRASLNQQSKVLGGREDLHGYINSGVLLMDCDAIRARPGLMDAMEDMAAAHGYPTVDQDRINVVFQDDMSWLDPAWNCSWGRLSLQRRLQKGLPSSPASANPVVLHFHGPHKPWHPLRLSGLKKGAASIWRYRRHMAEFRKQFPDLPTS